MHDRKTGTCRRPNRRVSGHARADHCAVLRRQALRRSVGVRASCIAATRDRM